jgi:hypothetical protein
MLLEMWQINPLAVKQVTSSAGLYSLAKHSIILCDTDYMTLKIIGRDKIHV